MKFSIAVLASLILGFVCSNTAVAEEIPIPGTGDGVAVLEAIGQAFTNKTGIEVRVPDSIGSSGGVKVAGMDRTVFARVARKLKDTEQDYGLNYKAIFTVPTVFFAHQGVSVDNLTNQQVLDIFSGKITNWRQVGGQSADIFVVRREDKDSSLSNLKESFPGFADMIFTKDAVLAEKTPTMVAQIVNREHSIGFGPLDVALANNLKVLKIDGIAPTDEGYPYFGTIALVYKEKNLTPSTRQFLAFATSAEAHDAIRKAGGIPLP